MALAQTYMLTSFCIWLGNASWNKLEAPEGKLYPWEKGSTYIKSPPFFEGMTKELPKPKPVKNASVLLNLGDSVTTDHISPAGPWLKYRGHLDNISNNMCIG